MPTLTKIVAALAVLAGWRPAVFRGGRTPRRWIQPDGSFPRIAGATSYTLLGSLNIRPLFNPVDMAAGANTGDWINLANYGRALFVLFKDGGVAGDDPTITFEQAQDNAGTGVKNLVAVSESYQMQAADIFTVAGWSRVTQTAAATLILNATSAEQEGMYAVEIAAHELDLANDFTHVRASVADVGAGGPQLGAMFVILGEPRYMDRPDALPNAIN